MVKLTADIIEQCAQYTNPVRDRELDLRGYKIPMIENMGATLDQFDTIDMSDNEVRKLDGFPLLRRLKTILLNNNRIVRIGEQIGLTLPTIDTLVLTNNSIQELGDLDNLGSMKSLTHLSLLRNPCTTKKHYRLYVIHKVPHLRVLDFQRIRLKEREASIKMFKGKKGAALAREMGKRVKTFVPGAGIPNAKKKVPGMANGAAGPANGAGDAVKAAPAPIRPDVEAIKLAITNAKTLEEIERLNKLLQAGQVPGMAPKQAPNPGMVKQVPGVVPGMAGKDGTQEEEEDDIEMDD